MDNPPIEKILFYSNKSRACFPILDFLQTSRINVGVKAICIDHPMVKKRVIEGKYFSIRFVPTLMIAYRDGNIQLFEAGKALLWVRREAHKISNPYTNSGPPIKPSTTQQPQRPVSHSSSQKQQPLKSKALDKSRQDQTSVIDPVPLDDDQQDNFSGDYEELDPVEELQSEINEIKSSRPPSITDQTIAAMQRKQSTKVNGMSNIMEQVAAMQKQRENSLGYKEEELPYM